MRLVPIQRDGAPQAPLGELTSAARDACAGMAALYAAVGFEPPWIGYLAVAAEAVVGTCAFKAPARDGRVEIAYFTFPGHEGRGYATRMAGELLALARRAQPTLLLVAQTQPEENASTAVLRRHGFRLAGEIEHPEDGRVWEWQRRAGDDRHRPASREDLPQIVTIYNATVPSRTVTADTEPVAVESRVRWFEAHTPERRPLWVCERDGRIAAWLSFSDFYGRPAYGRTAEVSVYVHEAHRKRGLGRYLLTEALRAAPAIGVDTLLGFIFGHNAPSLALFAKSGFERWGFLPRVAVLDGVERDLVIVGRRTDS